MGDDTHDDVMSPNEVTRLIFLEMGREMARGIMRQWGSQYTDSQKDDGGISKRKMQRQIEDLRARVSDLEKLMASRVPAGDLRIPPEER